MKRPELQHLTASETLTLEQEYDMQGSWREDDDQYTFVVLDKQRWGDPSIEEEQCMVGDINMFLTDPTYLSSAELEIMIAGQFDTWTGGTEIRTFNLLVGRRLLYPPHHCRLPILKVGVGGKAISCIRFLRAPTVPVRSPGPNLTVEAVLLMCWETISCVVSR
uniref:uncharacterized protein LOC109965283 isoform X2 n=1 Tax=Monopterus albus TaxID=43700 RepID=UPI0009B33441|nr:uncharacterized protein LOC109965283 isoform X2 [Monopterus albus]